MLVSFEKCANNHTNQTDRAYRFLVSFR